MLDSGRTNPATETSARRRRALALVLCGLVSAAACIDIDPDHGRLRLLAPASLGSALEAALLTHDGVLSGQPPLPVYGDPARQARAVAEGTDAAVLVTNHPAWASYVVARTTVEDRRVVARDGLVVVTPQSRALPGGDLASLADPSFRHIASLSTESAPAGMYAREALLRYGLWSDLSSRIDRVDDAEDALRRVRGGEADAALVLASDARAAGIEPTLVVDPAYHQPIWIEVLLLQSDPRARALFDFLVGDQARSAFQVQGFDISPPGTEGTL